MNEKVRIITDSGCDISRELEKEWEKYLVVMSFMVNINGKDYLDRELHRQKGLYARAVLQDT